MRTPAGKECRYFYGDYYRGREHEECRLLSNGVPPLTWKPILCSTCPTPGIIQANACPHMILTPSLTRPFPYIRQQVQIRAYCQKTQRNVNEPQIGCGECHPLPDVFTGENLD